MTENEIMLSNLMNMAGELMGCNAEIHRIEDTIKRMGMAYGAEEMNVFAITSSVIVTMIMPDGVVVAAALTCSPRQSLLLAFTGGVMLDLVPPADHYAGRWALALLLVAWCVQASRQGTRPGFGQTFVTAAAASFVGSSLFALSGLLLGDPEVGVGALLQTIMAAWAWDVVLTPLVVPVTMVAFRRLARDGAGREFERERI